MNGRSTLWKSSCVRVLQCGNLMLLQTSNSSLRTMFLSSFRRHKCILDNNFFMSLRFQVVQKTPYSNISVTFMVSCILSFYHQDSSSGSTGWKSSGLPFQNKLHRGAWTSLTCNVNRPISKNSWLSASHPLSCLFQKHSLSPNLKLWEHAPLCSYQEETPKSRRPDALASGRLRC